MLDCQQSFAKANYAKLCDTKRFPQNRASVVKSDEL